MIENQAETCPQTFSRFKELPQELQDQVWQDAISQADDRIVEIRNGSSMTSSCPIPHLLHSCQDARKLALNRWKPSFAKPGSQPRIFFDYSRDTLYFGQFFPNMDEFRTEAHSEGGLGKGVQQIAFSLESQWADSYDDLKTRARKINSTFPDLKHIVFINMNLDFDFEAFAQGEPQPASDPGKRLVAFTAVTYSGHQPIHRRLLNRLKESFQEESWTFPTWERMNYRYLREP